MKVLNVNGSKRMCEKVYEAIRRLWLWLKLMCHFYGDRVIICDVSFVVNFCLFVQCKNFWENFF